MYNIYVMEKKEKEKKEKLREALNEFKYKKKFQSKITS